MTGLRRLFLAPAGLLLALLFVCPLAIVAAYSLLSRGAYGGVQPPWTLENWARLADPLYWNVFGRSVVLAGVSTLICLAAAFPLALFIARSGPRRNLWLALVMLPFWTSFLVRTYSWLFLLRETGLLNTVLLASGLIREPLPLLYNDGAVILGLVYGYLPFMVLPLYAALERIDRSLLEAAADLGARPLSVLGRVVIPLSMPGVAAGSVLVFIPCLGAYLTPDLMGGGKTIMIGTLVQNQFTTARDWPFGAALSLALLGLSLVVLAAGFGRGTSSIRGGVDGSENAPRAGNPRILAVYAAAVFAFLYLPLAALAVFSFNSSRFTVWEGFSLRWYAAALGDPQLMEAAWNSVVIAFFAAVAATAAGTLCAYALWKRHSALITGALYATLVTPEIVMGVALLAFFQWIFRFLDVRLGMHTVILAHIAFSIAYVVLVVLARLRTMDAKLEEAALDLGANHWQAFCKVTLPGMLPAVGAAALLAFTVSFDDYVITSLVAGVDSETLPMVIYAMARRGANPVVNAVSSLIAAGFGALVLASERLRRTA